MAATKTPGIKEFPKDGKHWRVDWFGPIQRNPDIPTESYIQVIISPFLTHPRDLPAEKLSSLTHVISDEQKFVKIGVGQLPAIWIGNCGNTE